MNFDSILLYMMPINILISTSFSLDEKKFNELDGRRHSFLLLLS